MTRDASTGQLPFDAFFDDIKDASDKSVCHRPPPSQGESPDGVDIATRVRYVNGPLLFRDHSLRDKEAGETCADLLDDDVERGEMTFQNAGSNITKLIDSMEIALDGVPDDVPQLDGIWRRR